LRYSGYGHRYSTYIQKDEADKAANTAFFLFPIIAAVFYVISYFIAPLAADFFNEPKVSTIIRVLSFIFVIWSFGTLPNTLLNKNLDFKKKVHTADHSQDRIRK